MVNAGIIGRGRIGSELYRQLLSRNWNVSAILDIDGVYKNLEEKMDSPESFWLEYKHSLDIAFIAVPTLDDGFTAFKYMRSLLADNIPVVTCEKGSLSNYFSELEEWKGKIGYSATVGGGTRMLRYLEEKKSPKTKEIHVIANGTLNYLFDKISKGKERHEAAEETRRMGYAEPGANSLLEIISKEATKDLPMKASILFNIPKIASKIIRARDIKVKEICESDLERLIEEAKNRRYIVSISKEDNETEVIDGFKYKVDEWIVSAGFKRIDQNPLFPELITEGVYNALIIYDGKNKYRLSGPGAGAEPTAESMIKDAIDLLA